MISLEEYGVITRLDFHSSDPESRDQYLRNNADLVSWACKILLWTIINVLI